MHEGLEAVGPKGVLFEGLAVVEWVVDPKRIKKNFANLDSIY